jgi:hypothetical protein
MRQLPNDKEGDNAGSLKSLFYEAKADADDTATAGVFSQTPV